MTYQVITHNEWGELSVGPPSPTIEGAAEAWYFNECRLNNWTNQTNEIDNQMQEDTLAVSELLKQSEGIPVDGSSIYLTRVEIINVPEPICQ